MKSKVKCLDDNSLTKEERKRMTKESRRNNEKSLKDKQNSTNVEQVHEDTPRTTLLDVLESTKKNHKRKRCYSGSADEEVDCKVQRKDSCINESSKIKRQEATDIESTEITSCDSSFVDGKAKKKKRKKEKTSTDTNELSGDIESQYSKKRKVQNTLLAVGECTVKEKDSGFCSTVTANISHEVKNKKLKHKTTLSTDEEPQDKHNYSDDNLNSSSTQEDSFKPKKKNKKHVKQDTESLDETDDKIHKKKHNSTSENEKQASGVRDSVTAKKCVNHGKDAMDMFNVSDKIHKKKHKNKSESKSDFSGDEVVNDMLDSLGDQKGINHDSDAVDMSNVSDKIHKKHKNKSKSKSDINGNEVNSEIGSVAAQKGINHDSDVVHMFNVSDNIHKKKHRKKSKSDISGDVVVNDEFDSVAAQKGISHDKDAVDKSNVSDKIIKKKHKNKSKSKSDVIGDEEVNGGKVKHPQKVKNYLDNSTVDNAKNVMKKQELCGEIKGSGTFEHTESSDQRNKTELSPTCTAAVQGQWQGHLFENSERQNKFLRLLGGVKKSDGVAGTGKHSLATLSGAKKKGLFGSLVLSPNTSSSVALGVSAAASLNQKLEDQYNSALNFKLSGKIGTGLGFVSDPAAGKKFHIDINKSKSVKFDDD